MLVSNIGWSVSVSAYQKTENFGKRRFDEKGDDNLGYLSTLDSAAKVKKELELVNNEISEMSKLKRKRTARIRTAKSSNNKTTADVLTYNCDNLHNDEMISYLIESKKRLEEELKGLTKEEASLRQKLLVTA